MLCYVFLVPRVLSLPELISPPSFFAPSTLEEERKEGRKEEKEGRK